jgi:hypothetical protein
MISELARGHEDAAFHRANGAVEGFDGAVQPPTEHLQVVGDDRPARMQLPTKLRGSINLDEACEILSAIPDRGNALAAADTETRRGVFDAFRLSVVLDRNAHQIQVKALVSSAFTKARDLQSLVTNGAIAGAGFEPATSGL